MQEDQKGCKKNNKRAEEWGPKLACFECDDRLTWFLWGWSKLTRFSDAGRKSLSFSVSIEIELVLSGWSILTWSQCEGLNLTWFQFRDRNWFVFVSGARKRLGFIIWIEIDCDFVWWCSTANMYVWSLDRCVCYVLDDHSVTVNWVSQWFILYKRTKEVRAPNSVSQWFILCNRTKGVRASNSSQGWLSSSVVCPS